METAREKAETEFKEPEYKALKKKEALGQSLTKDEKLSKLEETYNN